jgi:hypothetical protein
VSYTNDDGAYSIICKGFDINAEKFDAQLKRVKREDCRNSIT